MKVWVCEESGLELYDSEEAARKAYKVFCEETGIEYDEEVFSTGYYPLDVWGNDSYGQFKGRG